MLLNFVMRQHITKTPCILKKAGWVEGETLWIKRFLKDISINHKVWTRFKQTVKNKTESLH